MTQAAHQQLTNSHLWHFPPRSRSARRGGLLARLTASLAATLRRIEARHALARHRERESIDHAALTADLHRKLAAFWPIPPC